MHFHFVEIIKNRGRKKNNNKHVFTTENEYIKVEKRFRNFATTSKRRVFDKNIHSFRKSYTVREESVVRILSRSHFEGGALVRTRTYNRR